MAANTRTKSVGFGTLDVVTATEFNKLDTNGAQSVNRNSTVSGSRRHSLLPVETYSATGPTKIATPVYGTLSLANQAVVDLYLNLLELPHGHTLNSVAIRMAPAGGHAGQPAVLPSINVYKISGSSATSLGSASYTWVDIATYHAGFTLTASGLAHAIDRGAYTYMVKVIPESGANSVTGLSLEYMNVDVTIDHAYGGTDLSIWI